METKKHYSVHRIEAHNIRRLVSVNITPPPKGGITVVGKNGSGKTSLVDTIAMGIGGGNKEFVEAIRRGTAKADLFLDFGDFTLARTIHRNGRITLEVKMKGEKAGIDSPQAFLDNIIGSLSLDPTDFLEMSAKEQVDWLLNRTVGDQLRAIESALDEAEDHRKEYNRRFRDVECRRRNMPVPNHHSELPDTPINVADLNVRKNALVYDRDKRAEWQRAIATQEANIRTMTGNIERHRADAETARAEYERIMTLTASLVREAEERMNEYHRYLSEAEIRLAEIADPALELTEVDTQIAQADDVNTAIRVRNDFAAVTKEMDELEEHIHSDNKRISELREQKTELLATAQLPVEGLAFDLERETLTLNGIASKQLSSSEGLIMAVLLAMHDDPTLRVIRIKHGEMFDDATLEAVCQIAYEKDYQAWIERVGTDGAATFIVEEGAVREDNQTALSLAPAQAAGAADPAQGE